MSSVSFVSDISDVLIATLAKLSKAVDAPVAGAAPHCKSVPSDVSICPLVPKGNLVVSLLEFLYIISPRVVIGSAKPSGTAAHFIPPDFVLSAVKT